MLIGSHEVPDTIVGAIIGSSTTLLGTIIAFFFQSKIVRRNEKRELKYKLISLKAQAESHVRLMYTIIFKLMSANNHWQFDSRVMQEFMLGNIKQQYDWISKSEKIDLEHNILVQENDNYVRAENEFLRLISEFRSLKSNDKVLGELHRAVKDLDVTPYNYMDMHNPVSEAFLKINRFQDLEIKQRLSKIMENVFDPVINRMQALIEK